MQDLRGKVAVITGGGSGLGRAFAHAFAGEGMRVVVADIDQGAADTVAGELKATGGEAIAVRCDVASRDSVHALASATFARFGGAHVVCNNAGVVNSRYTQDMTDADWDWVINVDLYGVVYGTEAFLPRMLEQGEGHFVNTASIAGLVPAASPGIVSYTTAKYGVVGLTESLALDLASSNVGVSVLCPGGVRTQIGNSARNRPVEFGGPDSGPRERLEGRVLAGTMREPEEVAAQVVRAVKENRLYILPHPENRPAVEERFAGLFAAYETLDRPLPAPGALAKFRGAGAVVTGGGSGIGRSVALAFAFEGINVVVADYDGPAAEAVAKEVQAAGARAISFQVDVRDRARMEALAERAFAEFGQVRLLHNNAGVVVFRPAQQVLPADWDWVMGVNLDGVVNGYKAFVPRLVKQGGPAHIVNTSSIAGIFPAPGLSSYCASKYAVTGLSEHSRVDLERVGIGVSVLCPGGVRTRIVDAGRNRPAEFGGPEEPPEDVRRAGAGTYTGMEPDMVAQLVVRGIANNEPFVVTHKENRPPLDARYQRILAAFGA